MDEASLKPRRIFTSAPVTGEVGATVINFTVAHVLLSTSHTKGVPTLRRRRSKCVVNVERLQPPSTSHFRPVVSPFS